MALIIQISEFLFRKFGVDLFCMLKKLGTIDLLTSKVFKQLIKLRKISALHDLVSDAIDKRNCALAYEPMPFKEEHVK